MKRKKITIAHVVGTLRDGGAETLLRGLIPRLAQAPDLDVHVVSVYHPRLNEQEITDLGAPLHVIGRRGRLDLSFAPRLLSTIRDLRPDVVHGHIHTGKYAGRIAAILAGVPHIVFTEHGDEAGGLLRLSVKRVLNIRTERFIVFTEEERRRYGAAERIPQSNIAVIPNGIPLPPAVDVDEIRRSLGIAAGEVAIVTAARLVHQKNQALAIRAVERLRAGGRSHLRLFVIGDGPDAEALRQLSTEHGLDEAVTFLGYRTDSLRIAAACDIMVLPSIWEKMPLVLGEAMLSGVPVVSTPWVGAQAFITDGFTGYLATGWSLDEFSAALARAVDHPNDRHRVAREAADAALQRFDLQRTADAHIALYRELALSNEISG